MDNPIIDTEAVEPELGNEHVIIDMPFDPNLIRVNTPPTNVGDIIDMLENGEIMLDTEFQRRTDLWDEVKKSRFIESLLLRLPIPKFYFDGHDDNKWRVIDGLQRISTLKSFMRESMRLQGLEFLKEYENKTFQELPRELQRRIKGSSLTVHILEKGTPDVVKFLLFSRINQSGLLLTPQEIRHAMHQGKAADLVKELVDKDSEVGQSFLKATENKIPTKRMEDRDFATRFVAFYLLSYENYKPDMDSFLNAGMAAADKLSKNDVKKLKFDFQSAMETTYAIFGNDAFRKRIGEYDQRKPINKALFEAFSVNFAKCSENEQQILVNQELFFKEKWIELNYSKKFTEAITQSTARKENVEHRFRMIQNLIQSTLDFQKGIETANIIFDGDAATKIANILGKDSLSLFFNSDFRKTYTMSKILNISLAECKDEDRNILIKHKDYFKEKLGELRYPIKSINLTEFPPVQLISKVRTQTNAPKFDKHEVFIAERFKDIQNIIKITLEHAQRTTNQQFQIS